MVQQRKKLIIDNICYIVNTLWGMVKLDCMIYYTSQINTRGSYYDMHPICCIVKIVYVIFTILMKSILLEYQFLFYKLTMKIEQNLLDPISHYTIRYDSNVPCWWISICMFMLTFTLDFWLQYVFQKEKKNHFGEYYIYHFGWTPFWFYCWQGLSHLSPCNHIE